MFSIRNAIKAATPVQTVLMTEHELFECDNITLVPGMVYPQDGNTIVRIETDELTSLRPCCGTHARNTSELQDFYITDMHGAGNRGVFQIEAVSGAMAVKVIVFNEFS